MKKFLSIALVPLLLVGCSSSKETKEVAAPVDVKSALEGSEFECNGWDELADDYAKCTMNRDGSINGGGVLSVSVTTSDAELLAAMKLDEDDSLPGAVWGDNWTGTCSEDVGSENCGKIADLLGVEVLYQQ